MYNISWISYINVTTSYKRCYYSTSLCQSMDENKLYNNRCQACLIQVSLRFLIIEMPPYRVINQIPCFLDCFWQTCSVHRQSSYKINRKIHYICIFFFKINNITHVGNLNIGTSYLRTGLIIQSTMTLKIKCLLSIDMSNAKT